MISLRPDQINFCPPTVRRQAESIQIAEEVWKRLAHSSAAGARPPSSAIVKFATPKELEMIVARLCTEGGWTARVVGKVGDKGIDVVVTRPRAGDARSDTAVVQVKHWQTGVVGRGALDEASLSVP